MEAWQIAMTILFAYCGIMITIGYLAKRVFKKSLEDFYVLSRRAGFIVIFLSLASTYHSAFAFLTSVAVFSAAGVSFWIAAAPWTVLTGIFGYLYGKRVFALGKKKKFITPADLLADYYESHTVRFLTAILQATFIIAYITVQAIGLGIILSIASGGHIPYVWASFVLLMVTAAYVILGGLRAAYWTDVIQGAWMYIGVWVAALVIFFKFFPGGFPQLTSTLLQVNPKLLTLNFPPENLFGYLIVYSIGLLLLPHLWIKYYAARDTWTVKWSSFSMAVYLSTYYIPAMLVGLTAAVLNAHHIINIPALKAMYGSRDAVMAYMIMKFTPPVLAGFLLAGAAAAAMSTLDSFIGSTSMILTRDIYQRIRKNASERELIIVGRLFILLWALIGWWWAVTKPGLIFNLTAVAGAGGLQFLPAIIQALFIKKKQVFNKYGVITGIIVSSALVFMLVPQIGGKLGFPWTFNPAVAGLIALGVNFVITYLVSLRNPRLHEERRKEYDEILSEI